MAHTDTVNIAVTLQATARMSVLIHLAVRTNAKQRVFPAMKANRAGVTTLREQKSKIDVSLNIKPHTTSPFCLLKMKK